MKELSYTCMEEESFTTSAVTGLAVFCCLCQREFKLKEYVANIWAIIMICEMC